MLLFPHCKINLGLDVLRRRSDGFHDIETVMYPVSGLCDGLEIVPAPGDGAVFTFSGISFDCPGDKNLVSTAYDLMRTEYGIGGVKIHLHKAIPLGAGLGGGSSDAAFVLRGLNTVFTLGLDADALESLAARLGSDAPFFIQNRPRLCEGRGEVMSDAAVDLSGKYIVIVKPPFAVSTAEAYAGIRPYVPQVSLRERISRPLHEWRGSLTNAFRETVFARYPLLADIEDSLYNAGALYASMSGSGSAMFGIFDADPGITAIEGCDIFAFRL